MSSLSGILSEPANGTTVVVEYIGTTEAIRRDDERADAYQRERRWQPLIPEQRWFPLYDDQPDSRPETWHSVVCDAKRMWALGELLADTEAEPAENAADVAEGEHHDQWCDCSDCAERGRNAHRRAKREAGR